MRVAPPHDVLSSGWSLLSAGVYGCNTRGVLNYVIVLCTMTIKLYSIQFSKLHIEYKVIWLAAQLWYQMKHRADWSILVNPVYHGQVGHEGPASHFGLWTVYLMNPAGVKRGVNQKKKQTIELFEQTIMQTQSPW